MALDPTSPDNLAADIDEIRLVVVVCNEGFSSSLAAATLQRLGLLRAADLIGGFQEWARAAGGPEVAARAFEAEAATRRSASPGVGAERGREPLENRSHRPAVAVDRGMPGE